MPLGKSSAPYAVLRLPRQTAVKRLRMIQQKILCGKPLSLDDAMHIADVGQSAIGPLRAGHLIRTISQIPELKVETYHDAIRESITSRLDHAEKQQVHLRIAEHHVQQLLLSPDGIIDRLTGDLVER